MSKYKSVEEAARSVQIAHLVTAGAISSDAAILALIEQNEMLVAEVMELYLIAPKKVRGLNGQTWIYQCPEALIPDHP